MLYNSLVKGEEMRKIKQKNNFTKKNIEMLNILNKYRSNLIETILSKDNEIVQNIMASTLGDYREMEKNSN